MQDQTRGGPAGPPAGSLKPAKARILVVEDDPLIALDLAQLVAELGHAPVGPAVSVAQALALLDADLPDAALLDEMIRGQSVLPVALRLAQARRPFLVVSGHASALTDDPTLAGAPRIVKPVGAEALAGAMLRMLGSATIDGTD